MKHQVDIVLDATGKAISGASVRVNVANASPGTGALATIYSDDGITTTANPTLTDSTGTYGLYVADGRYDLTISATGFTTKIIADIEIADITQAQSGDTPVVLVFTSLTSATTNPASAGQVRLASADTIKWRNNANSADIIVSKNSSDQLVLPTVASLTSAGNIDLGANKITGSGSTAGLTLKKGTGAGNYTSASTSYVRPDSTNLSFAVVVPTGWKLGIQASGTTNTATAAVLHNVALADGVADNTGILMETQSLSVGAGAGIVPFSLSWVVTGDGATHTINLQYKTSNAADSVVLENSSASKLPTMVFTLLPSN